MLTKKVTSVLKRQHYFVVGKSSAVQICGWAKKSLKDEDFCYKEKFYGIKSHKCCQMSPAVMWCQNKCLHCWRAIELNLGEKISKADKPKKIIEGCVKAQKKLISGFGGNGNVNKKKFKQAQTPSQFAISLSGEPTIYPKLAELIKELRKQRKTSFLVTNGLLPEKLLELKKKKALPTQLYLSLNFPNEKLFKKITKNKKKNSWKKFNKSLKLIEKMKTRTVIRMTLVKDLNMKEEHVEPYADLIKKANPMFIEVKGFMSVGYARQRLEYKRMPRHWEIQEFSNKLLKKLPGYKFLDDKKESRVVLLGKTRKSMKIKRKER
jgi:tRNA wybutosine-synthesizing protein 1